MLDWRAGRLSAPRDPPFQRPQPVHDEEDAADEEDEPSYTHIPPVRSTASPANRYDNSDSAQSPFADPQRYSQAPTSTYTQPLAGRPSMDAYGAFSDPAPSGFGYTSTASPTRSNVAAPPILPEPDLGGPMVSRTMQYADPYAAVRASIAGQASPPGPPSYETYSGYR